MTECSADVEFAKSLRAVRRAKEMSQSELARRATENGFRLHQTQLAKIENGARKVTLGEAAALCAALDGAIFVDHTATLRAALRTAKADLMAELEAIGGLC